MLRVLAEREFRLLWLGQSASTIGDRLVFVAFVLAGGLIGMAVAATGFAIPDVWRLRAVEHGG